MVEEMSDKEPDSKQDKDKAEAKQTIEKKMKLLGIVGVVYDEKTGLVMGVEDNGTPKVLNHDDASFIISKINTISSNRNSYALGDQNKDNNDAAQVDSVKANELIDEGEKKKKEKETKQRIDDAKNHSQETKKEPNAFETALNRVLGKNPDKLKADVHSGRISPELETVCRYVATRAATNMAQTTSKAVVNAAEIVVGRL